MPYFLLTFGDARRPPLAAVIIEAPSTFQARMTAVVRRLAPGVPFGEDLKLSAEMMKTIPPEEIGRMMSGVEAAELILRQARQAKMLPKTKSTGLSLTSRSCGSRGEGETATPDDSASPAWARAPPIPR
jgi:hypothetical protein